MARNVNLSDFCSSFVLLNIGATARNLRKKTVRHGLQINIFAQMAYDLMHQIDEIKVKFLKQSHAINSRLMISL